MNIKAEKTTNYDLGHLCIKSKTHVRFDIKAKNTTNYNFGDLNVVLGGGDPKLVGLLVAGYFVCRLIDRIWGGFGGGDDDGSDVKI